MDGLIRQVLSNNVPMQKLTPAAEHTVIIASEYIRHLCSCVV